MSVLYRSLCCLGSLDSSHKIERKAMKEREEGKKVDRGVRESRAREKGGARKNQEMKQLKNRNNNNNKICLSSWS